MLVLLGFAMIAVFMVLIMTKKLTPVLALIIVPTVFGLFAGAGLGIGDMVMDSMKSMTSTAALLMFAIIYFGLMIDVGLFDPLVRFILRKLGNDPAKVVLGTAILAAAVSLDGDGSTTFILTTAAMLPIYLRLKMSPVVLTCVAGLANGTMNIVPVGRPHRPRRHRTEDRRQRRLRPHDPVADRRPRRRPGLRLGARPAGAQPPPRHPAGNLGRAVLGRTVHR